MMMDKIHDERDDDPECIPSRVGPPAAAMPAAIESGMWFNMVNVKVPFLADL